MAKQNIPPTKSNFLKLKQTSSIAQEGYQLLDQKREILVMELMSYLERIKAVEKELYHLFHLAYQSLKKTFCSIGHEEATKRVRFINYDYPVRKRMTKILGIQMPSIEVDTKKISLQYSFLNTNATVDETTSCFLNLIGIICEMAEMRAIVWRLSQEVKKIQRRVNALEKIVIPNTEETLKYIEDTLEEREREALFISKMLKAKLENT
ncbi:MAG: V-type ATP synthase subunit D [Spirochaetes bacterium]|nr:V-type ATP synthase subunit D [Spirochaetota bacterium]